MAYFSQKQQFNTLAGNTQGVCFDDDYFYITEASEIMKYTRGGEFVARHDTVGDGSSNHLGDLCIKDGILYVMSSLYPSGPPYNEIVMLYDAETLTYIQEYSTFTDHIGEGIDYRHGHFWTVSDNFDEVYKWEDGFTSPTTYPITEPTITGSVHHFQTIVWIDDDTIAMALHGGPSPALPQTVLFYRFANDEFRLVRQITPPSPVIIFGQGMAWDATTNIMYFANRDDINNEDKVTGAKLVEYPDSLMFDANLSVDKLVRVFTGSYNAATDLVSRVGSLGTIFVYRIPHGLGRPVFCELLWSNDGGVTYTDGGITNSSGLTKLAFSDSTYVYIFHGYTTAATTITYKVYCTWIDDYDDTNPLVSTVSYSDSSLQFDSRLNYQKIYRQRKLDFTAGTGGSTETQSIGHSLGNYPNTKLYFEAFPNEVWPLNAGGANNFFNYDSAQDEAKLEIFANSVSFSLLRFSNSSKRAWYRIYYDAT